MNSFPAPRVVILGGGFAGLECCKALAKTAASITLVDRQNHHLFQPLLYQVASAGLSAPEIAQPIRAILSHQKNARVIMAEVTSIDLEQRRVQLTADCLEYDFLIIALGAQTGYFGHDDWQAYAPGLKTLDDAMQIRRRVLLAYEHAETCQDPTALPALLTTIVVGGGPTGVEMAGAMAELAQKVLKRDFRTVDPTQAKIILIEAGPRLLGTFSEDLSDYTREKLTSMGVTVKVNTPVTAAGEGYLICGTERIDAANIIWAAGVEASPVSRTMKGIPLDRAGRIQVSADCSLPAYPQVFAVGDIASLTDSKGVKVPGLCPAALQMGRFVGRLIATEIEPPDDRPWSRPTFAYWDKGSMATIGRSAAIAAVNGMKFKGFIAWLLWLFVHLLFLVGFRNKTAVFFQWIYAYCTYKRGARIISGTK